MRKVVGFRILKDTVVQSILYIGFNANLSHQAAELEEAREQVDALKRRLEASLFYKFFVCFCGFVFCFLCLSIIF